MLIPSMPFGSFFLSLRGGSRWCHLELNASCVSWQENSSPWWTISAMSLINCSPVCGNFVYICILSYEYSEASNIWIILGVKFNFEPYRASHRAAWEGWRVCECLPPSTFHFSHFPTKKEHFLKTLGQLKPALFLAFPIWTLLRFQRHDTPADYNAFLAFKCL